ncbi:calcium-binding protein [Streptomyces sp. NPDC058171]
MKTRAFVALATGALALTTVNAPTAHADDRDAFSALRSGAVTAAAADVPKITSIKVNGGKDLVVGTSKKTFTVKFTAQHPKGVDAALAGLWKGGPDIDRAPYLLLPPPELQDRPCIGHSRTTTTCTFTYVADPKSRVPKADLANAFAGRWNVAVAAISKNDKLYDNDKHAKHSIKRAAKLTANASPEPVRRGADVTVTGGLTRANWDNHKYAGFASGAVKVQFKKQGTRTWTTVKTVRADSRGTVRTKAKASADGHYRLAYGGSTTTGRATSTADFIDVR